MSNDNNDIRHIPDLVVKKKPLLSASRSLHTVHRNITQSEQPKSNTLSRTNDMKEIPLSFCDPTQLSLTGVSLYVILQHECQLLRDKRKEIILQFVKAEIVMKAAEEAGNDADATELAHLKDQCVSVRARGHVCL